MERILTEIVQDELMPLFRWAGSLYEMRTMFGFSGENRGFCYVRYSCPAEAEQARR